MLSSPRFASSELSDGVGHDPVREPPPLGPVFPYGRRRCPVVVDIAANPQAGGCRITARAEAAFTNYFHAKITRDLYDARLASLLDAVEGPAGPVGEGRPS